MNNAEKVIRAFGGVTRLSDMIKIPISTISMWKRDKPVGSGGRIPDKHKRGLAILANDKGLDINSEIWD